MKINKPLKAGKKVLGQGIFAATAFLASLLGSFSKSHPSNSSIFLMASNVDCGSIDSSVVMLDDGLYNEDAGKFSPAFKNEAKRPNALTPWEFTVFTKSRAKIV